MIKNAGRGQPYTLSTIYSDHHFTVPNVQLLFTQWDITALLQKNAPVQHCM
jgi:hypothetical protein